MKELTANEFTTATAKGVALVDTSAAADPSHTFGLPRPLAAAFLKQWKSSLALMVSDPEKAVQINDRHNLAAVDEDSRQPRRAAHDPLQPDARHDFVDSADVWPERQRGRLRIRVYDRFRKIDPCELDADVQPLSRPPVT